MPEPRSARSAPRGATPTATTGPADPSASIRRRVVVARPKAYEQRTTVPKMRAGPGRQRSLRLESRPLPTPFQLPRLPRPSLRLGALTPARAASLVLAAACVGLLALMFASDAFYVYTADIQGNRLISAQDVYARSGVDGQNILKLRPSETARRLRDLPFVKDAWVSVNLPAQVAIEIEERAPVAVWQVAGVSYGIADDGTVLPADGAPPGAPVIQAEGNALQYGLKLDPEVISLAARLKELVPHAQRVVFSNERGMGVVTAQGFPAYFGVQDDATAARVALLNGLTAQLKDQKIDPAYVDLRVPSRPIYGMKTTTR